MTEEFSHSLARAMYSPLLAKSREDPRYGELVEKMRRMNGL